MNVGVPQGTLCGPILWIAFVDSLQFSEGSSRSYADDTSCYYPMSSSNSLIIENQASSVTFEMT